MDPFETYDEVKRIADGQETETSKRIVFDLDFSCGGRLRDALKDLMIPFSTSGRVLTSTGGWGTNRKCSLCSKTSAWDELFHSLSEENKQHARADLSQSQMPVLALQKLAAPAPFGKGNKTVIDTNVRQAFEIPAVSLPNKLFPADAPPDKTIAQRIESTMKPQDAAWTYKLYKMHIYGKGGKFMPHVDTLHADNHIATLVVGLPGSYEGGQLHVKQEDNEVIYDLSSKPMEMKWAAFYTDCSHEVVEVTQGYRIVLQYDIYEEKKEGSKVEEEDEKEDEKFDLYDFGDGCIPDNLKKSWSTNSFVTAVSESLKQGPKGAGVGLLMRHRYSLGSLSAATLKGIDRFIYDAVKASGQFDVTLTGLVVSGSSEDGCYTKNEVSVNAISMADFDVKAPSLKFPCKTAKLILDSGRERMKILKCEHYMEYTGNEAQEGSMAYHHSAFVIAAKREEEERKRSGSDDEDRNSEDKKIRV